MSRPSWESKTLRNISQFQTVLRGSSPPQSYGLSKRTKWMEARSKVFDYQKTGVHRKYTCPRSRHTNFTYLYKRRRDQMKQHRQNQIRRENRRLGKRISGVRQSNLDLLATPKNTPRRKRRSQSAQILRNPYGSLFPKLEDDEDVEERQFSPIKSRVVRSTQKSRGTPVKKARKIPTFRKKTKHKGGTGNEVLNIPIKVKKPPRAIIKRRKRRSSRKASKRSSQFGEVSGKVDLPPIRRKKVRKKMERSRSIDASMLRHQTRNLKLKVGAVLGSYHMSEKEREVDRKWRKGLKKVKSRYSSLFDDGKESRRGSKKGRRQSRTVKGRKLKKKVEGGSLRTFWLIKEHNYL